MGSEKFDLDDLLEIVRYASEASATGIGPRVTRFCDVHLIVDDFRIPLSEFKLKDRINNSLEKVFYGR